MATHNVSTRSAIVAGTYSGVIAVEGRKPGSTVTVRGASKTTPPVATSRPTPPPRRRRCRRS